MNTKKRKPLGSAIEEFVFGTKEALPTATSPQAALPASILLTTPPPFALLPMPTAKPPQPEASAPEPVFIQSREPSLMSKLRVPGKEATVRFTVDMSETLHRKLSMLAARTGRKKVDRLCGCCWRMG